MNKLPSTDLDSASRQSLPPPSGIRIGEVGLGQKLLIWALLFGLVSHLALPLLLLAVPFQWYAVFKLVSALNVSTMRRVAWLLLMVVPIFNLIGLLYLNQQATRILRSAGYSVGFWGVNIRDLPAYE